MGEGIGGRCIYTEMRKGEGGVNEENGRRGRRGRSIWGEEETKMGDISFD